MIIIRYVISIRNIWIYGITLNYINILQPVYFNVFSHGNLLQCSLSSNILNIEIFTKNTIYSYILVESILTVLNYKHFFKYYQSKRHNIINIYCYLDQFSSYLKYQNSLWNCLLLVKVYLTAVVLFNRLFYLLVYAGYKKCTILTSLMRYRFFMQLQVRVVIPC